MEYLSGGRSLEGLVWIEVLLEVFYGRSYVDRYPF